MSEGQMDVGERGADQGRTLGWRGRGLQEDKGRRKDDRGREKGKMGDRKMRRP